jgi:aldehyde:ferredoxin oxidoreductase
MNSLGIYSIIITGRAVRPVYQYLRLDDVKVNDARHLWGLDNRVTEERLKQDCGSLNIDMLTIGPAGETGMSYACIMAGRDHAADRTGMGALMGAKNRKAIVLRAAPKKENQTAVSNSTGAMDMPWKQ